MKKLITLLLSISVSSFALAATSSGTSVEYRSPEIAIKARQDQFEDIKASFKQLRFAVIQKEFNAKDAQKYADEMAELSQPLVEMFRVRSDQGDTKALNRIWDNWPRFEKQMRDFIALTEKTSDSLKYANQEDARMYVDQAAKSCKSCHRLFKAR